jgi:hypothetical protein
MSLRSTTRLCFAPLLLCASFGAGRADSLALAQPETLVRLFVTVCYANMFNLGNIEHTLRSFDAYEEHGPWPGAARRWQIVNADESVIIVESKDTLWEKPTNTCEVVTNAPVSQLITALNEQFGSKNLFATRTNQGVRYTHWYGRVEGKSVLVKLLDWTPGDSQATGVGFIAIANQDASNF